MADTALTFEYKPSQRGQTILTAKLGEEVLFTNRLDISRAEQQGVYHGDIEGATRSCQVSQGCFGRVGPHCGCDSLTTTSRAKRATMGYSTI